MSFVDVMSFVGGAADRAREYDKAETERAQRLAEIKSKRQDELLKTRWSEAKKKRDKDVERYEGFIDKGGDITSLQTQSYLLGYNDVASMQKDIVKTNKAGGTFDWADAPIMPPELEAIKYSDEDAIYKSLLKTQGTTAGQIVEALGGPAREKREVELTDEQLGSVSTYRRATPTPLTEEQKKTLSGYEFKDDAEKLKVSKEADYHFSQYSNPNLFPEYKDASVSALRRLAYDVAVGTVKVTPEGLPWNIQEETIASYSNALFTKPVTPTTDSGAVTTPENDEGYVPLAKRKEEKETKEKLEKESKKKAEEERAVERTVPSKVTSTDVGLAGNVLSSATYNVKGKELSFMDELSEENKNRIESDVAGNVNAIINQTRMSQSEAYALATSIAKSGLTHEGDNMLTDLFTNEFSYQSPIMSWKDVYDTYEALKAKNPTLTYDMVVRTIIKKEKSGK